MHAAPDDLITWIGALRGRLARGELDGLGPYDTGRGLLPMPLAARVILADVDHFGDLSPERRHAPDVLGRRRLLLGELRRLRELIG